MGVVLSSAIEWTELGVVRVQPYPESGGDCLFGTFGGFFGFRFFLTLSLDTDSTGVSSGFCVGGNTNGAVVSDGKKAGLSIPPFSDEPQAAFAC